MKKLILIYLVLLTVSVAMAQRFPPGALVSSKRAASGGGPCTTERLSEGESWDDSHDMNYYTWRACSFTTGGSGYTVCSVQWNVWRSGSPTGTIVAKIYTDSSGSPGTLVGTASDAVDVSTISTDNASFQTFSGLSATLSSSTTYWVVFQASGSMGANISARADLTGESTNLKGSADGSAWDAIASGGYWFKLLSQ